MRRSTFLTGFLIAGLIAVIVWYYQKSTTTEDGALDLLNRYAHSQRRVSELETALATMPPAAESRRSGGTSLQ